MSRYVFVHGAWHGAWCWYRIVPQLRRAGHEAVALDLPSLGRDQTPLAMVTLDSWVDAVGKVLTSNSEPSILVGHSLGGLVISQAAERYPEHVEKLVYVAALLLRAGESPFATIACRPPIVPDLMRISSDHAIVELNFAKSREGFYGECSDEDVALAETLLRLQAAAPLATPLAVTQAQFGQVPRFYVECLRDKALDPQIQRAMVAATPCQRVFSLDTDHSPFFSRSLELANYLEKIHRL